MLLRKSGCLDGRRRKTQSVFFFLFGVFLFSFPRESKSKKKRSSLRGWGWWMRRWWHFDRGNLELTGPRLSHESKCVSLALEMEGCSLWLWHPSEGLRLLGVKCDTSLGRCWFSAATVQQTSSHGVSGGVWARGWGAPDRERRPNAPHPHGRHLTACKSPHPLRFHYIFIFKHAYC